MGTTTEDDWEYFEGEEGDHDISSYEESESESEDGDQTGTFDLSTFKTKPMVALPVLPPKKSASFELSCTSPASRVAHGNTDVDIDDMDEELRNNAPLGAWLEQQGATSSAETVDHWLPSLNQQKQTRGTPAALNSALAAEEAVPRVGDAGK